LQRGTVHRMLSLWLDCVVPIPSVQEGGRQPGTKVMPGRNMRGGEEGEG